MSGGLPVTRIRSRLMAIALALVTVCADPAATAQDRLTARVGDGSVLLQSPSGELLVAINTDRPMVPASLLKIPLAHVAFTTLGEDFRFTTEFYRNADGDLLIRGLGDPYLVSEEIALMAQQLHDQDVHSVRRLVVDDSAFAPAPELPLEPGADDPYAARNSALAVNFNTVNLAWDADGRLISGEPQTPLTPVARELAARLRPGGEQRIHLGDDPVNGLRQVQQVFQHFLLAAGISISDTEFHHRSMMDDPAAWTLVYRHANSRSLREVLEGLLRYSNNFIANQIFLTLGAQAHGYPATVANARAVLQQRLAALYGPGFGSNPDSLLMVEGSGLGREQRSTAAAMLRILEGFAPYADLLPLENGALRKSGTLTGVYNFAGYLDGPDGRYPFVILTQQPQNHRAEILRLLQARL